MAWAKSCAARPMRRSGGSRRMPARMGRDSQASDVVSAGHEPSLSPPITTRVHIQKPSFQRAKQLQPRCPCPHGQAPSRRTSTPPERLADPRAPSTTLSVTSSAAAPSGLPAACPVKEGLQGASRLLVIKPGGGARRPPVPPLQGAAMVAASQSSKGWPSPPSSIIPARGVSAVSTCPSKPMASSQTSGMGRILPDLVLAWIFFKGAMAARHLIFQGCQSRPPISAPRRKLISKNRAARRTSALGRPKEARGCLRSARRRTASNCSTRHSHHQPHQKHGRCFGEGHPGGILHLDPPALKLGNHPPRQRPVRG